MNFKAGPTVLPGCIICLQEKQNVIFTRLLKPLPQITFILKKGFSDQSGGSLLDNLIRKKSQDPIGLQRQGVIVNYIPKFQVATMSLEVA